MYVGVYVQYTKYRPGKETYLVAITKLRKATDCFVMSFRPSVLPSTWKNSVPIGQIFMKFDI